jgi:hypothetical protein
MIGAMPLIYTVQDLETCFGVNSCKADWLELGAMVKGSRARPYAVRANWDGETFDSECTCSWGSSQSPKRPASGRRRWEYA